MAKVIKVRAGQSMGVRIQLVTLTRKQKKIADRRFKEVKASWAPKGTK